MTAFSANWRTATSRPIWFTRMTLDDLTDEHAELMAHMMLKIKEVCAQEGLENGYRCVINTGEDGQQTVKHLHIHILGKRAMTWPPG